MGRFSTRRVSPGLVLLVMLIVLPLMVTGHVPGARIALVVVAGGALSLLMVVAAFAEPPPPLERRSILMQLAGWLVRSSWALVLLGAGAILGLGATEDYRTHQFDPVYDDLRHVLGQMILVYAFVAAIAMSVQLIRIGQTGRDAAVSKALKMTFGHFGASCPGQLERLLHQIASPGASIAVALYCPIWAQAALVS